MVERPFDISNSKNEKIISVYIDGAKVEAISGETVLATLMAYGKRAIAQNDYGIVSGAYCGMGVCFLCLVKINGQEKQRSCQTLVDEGMKIETQISYDKAHLEYSLHNLEDLWPQKK